MVEMKVIVYKFLSFNLSKGSSILSPFATHVLPKRCFWGWLNTVFNKVDPDRIREVGPDRACAEWLMRCGAFVKWKNFEKWQTDYNQLPAGNFERYKIEEIDGTDSCIMSIGFPHLKGLKHLKKMKLHKCFYLDDASLEQLSYVKASLQNLQVTTCGNVSDKGILSLKNLSELQELYMFDLPEVKEREKCLEILRRALPHCTVDFPSNLEMEKRKESKEGEDEEKT